MEEFEFSIVASGVDQIADDFEQRFFGAGCSNAVPSYQGGKIVLHFTREGETVEAAIAAAKRDIVAAGAEVVSANCPALGAGL